MNAMEEFLHYLVSSGRLGPEDINYIKSLTSQSAEPVDQLIAKSALMTETEFARSLSDYTDIPLLDTGQATPTPIDKPLNRTFLERHRILVFNQDGKSVIALVDPFNAQARSGMKFILGAEAETVLITHTYWERHFDTLCPTPVCEESIEVEHPLDISADATRLADMASSEPVIRLVNRLIEKASRDKASDIHIEPGLRNASIRYRIDGVLHAQKDLTQSEGLSVISRVKILSDLDIAERRRPQDGRMSFPVAGKAIDLRVSTVPTEHGESLVLRLLDKENVELSFTGLGFAEQTTTQLQSMLARPHGIMLVTGPTGSGKTTSLYTFLQELTTGDRKILTIEDPIEYRLQGVSQSQINPQIDVTFASALRAFLRHDPDVMMVGEIRDLETATIAIQAALTGHLVLSTLHTNDAASAITRLRDIGVEDYLIASTLIGVMGQRLVRRACAEHVQVGTCPDCDGSGHKGRLAITETLVVDTTLQEVIRAKGSEQDLIAAATGFTSMRADGEVKIADGLTTRAELTRALGASAPPTKFPARHLA